MCLCVCVFVFVFVCCVRVCVAVCVCLVKVRENFGITAWHYPSDAGREAESMSLREQAVICKSTAVRF